MYGPEINKSYFFAVDTKRGWGNTSFFTYFSEFDRPSSHVAYIEAGFLTALFVLSVIGNVFIIGFIICSRDLRTITNYFVCNLALADILFVTSGPFIAQVRISETWKLGVAMCHYLSYAMFVCGIVMIWTMAVISIDRFVCINLKRTSSTRLQPKYVLVICVVIWIISFTALCPIAIYFDVITVKTGTDSISFCSLLWPKSDVRYSAIFTVCAITVGFIVPFVIIIVNYTRIFKTLRATRIAVAHSTKEVTLPARTSSIKRRNTRVVNTLVLLVLLFFLMLTPLFITFILIQQDAANESFVVPSHALVWTVVLSFSNACINPFLYGYLNNKLKQGLIAICKCKQRKKFSFRNNNVHASINTVSSVSEERL